MCSREHAIYYHSITHDLPGHLAGIPSLYREWYGINFLKHARRFVEATGRLPTQRQNFRGCKIGEWLAKRRTENRLGVLSGERIQLIQDALGVDLDVDVLVRVVDVDFGRKLADVAEHQRLHGRLPTQYGDADHLGVWLMNCRRDANDGSLSEVHMQCLDTVLGAEWSPEFKNHTVSSHITSPCGAKYTPCWHCL